MRCIEIVTMDLYVHVTDEINRNMRCIEIFCYAAVNALPLQINRNMRCIEMWANPDYPDCED